MIHLGDITKISGYEAPAVDVVVGGSPCQDLSVAWKRAGLAGERSGLYMEQIRIIKEMREADVLRGRTDVDIRPRYMVWENVPGAFSSNGGKDFAAVIEEAIRVAEPEAPDVPVPEKGWPTSGVLFDECGRWSVAWRVLDAQFWGVPQRRRRIALVADFGGKSASEVLFVTEGVSGNPQSGKPKGEETARHAQSCSGADDRESGAVTFEPGIAAREGGHIYEGVSGTLRANAGDNQMTVAYTLKIRSGCEGGGKGALVQEDKSATLATNNDQYLFQPVVYDARGNGNGDTVSILTGDHNNRITDYSSVVVENQPVFCLQGGGATSQNCQGAGYKSGTSYTLNTTDVHGVVYGIGSYHSNAWKSGNPDSGIYEADTAKTLDALNCGYPACNQGGMAIVQPIPASGKNAVLNAMQGFGHYIESEEASSLKSRDYKDATDLVVQTEVAGVDCRNMNEYQELYPTIQAKPNGGQSLNFSGAVRHNYIVRRLTPLECERLQGFPDGWTDIGEWLDSKGKKHKEADSPRYKALGNSIAIPPWKWVMKRLSACYERDATLASLFDGIGGFPYIWEQINGKGSCLWASEIEEFPIAVTKLRFGG